MYKMVILDIDNKIIGDVIDVHNFGFDAYLYEEGSIPFETIESLLKWVEDTNFTLKYSVGNGVFIPVNSTTYEHQSFLLRIGWWRMTPAQSVIFSMLNKERETGYWISTEQLSDMLKIFGLKPSSLQEQILRIRKKIKPSGLSVENLHQIGYRLVKMEPKSSMRGKLSEEIILREPKDIKQDFDILLSDPKLHKMIDRHFSNLFITASPGSGKTQSLVKLISGMEILQGWQGLTRTESEIYFELVKHRGEWVSHQHFLKLPWATKKPADEDLQMRNLANFVYKIRQKLAEIDEVIKTKRSIGYCLK